MNAFHATFLDGPTMSQNAALAVDAQM